MLERMKEGAQLKDLRKMAGQSTVYRALQDYFEYAEDRVTKLHREIVELNASLKGKKEGLNKINSTLESKKALVEELEEDRIKIEVEHRKFHEARAYNSA